jgi:hypothetical protein
MPALVKRPSEDQSNARQIVASVAGHPHIRGMTPAPTRIALLATALLLGAATLGCGFLSSALQTVNNLSAISDMTDLLGKSAQLTFTADYKLVDGSGTATVVQQPPNAAFLGKSGSFILTADALLWCSKSNGRTTCQRTPNSGGQVADAEHGAMMTAIGGGGFISTPMALSLLTAASVVPGVKVDKTKRAVAGVDGTCLKATGLPKDSNPRNVNPKEFTVCVADNGVLTTFIGTGTDDKSFGVELTSYRTTVDPKAFKPPAGAKIVNVDQLQPGN